MARNDRGLRTAYPRAMVTRIGPKTPRKHYLAAWRLKRGLTQEQLAERLGTYKSQVSNWENYRRDITPNVQLALAEALDIEPGDIFFDPAKPSPSELLRDSAVHEMTLILNNQNEETRQQALEMIKVLVRRAS